MIKDMIGWLQKESPNISLQVFKKVEKNLLVCLRRILLEHAKTSPAIAIGGIIEEFHFKRISDCITKLRQANAREELAMANDKLCYSKKTS